MKKFIISLICIGLLTNSMASALDAKRLWQCITASERNKCTASEKKEARAWIFGLPAAVIVAILAAVGIFVTVNSVNAKKSELTAQGEIPVSLGEETQEERNKRNLQEIETSIITLKLDQQAQENKLTQAKSNEEQARIRQVIQGIKQQIKTLEDAKKLVGTTATYQWR